MKSRYLFMKILGLMLIILGFSYSLTSFYNFFEYIFGYKIYMESLNIILMIIGLIIPVYVFIYGIYFYFYSDFNITKTNKLLMVNYIFLLAISLIICYLKENTYVEIFEFVHISFGYCLFLLSIFGIYGCMKYKY